jgi:hypothetical protein
VLSTYGFCGLKRHQCAHCDPRVVDPRWAVFHQDCEAEEQGLLTIVRMSDCAAFELRDMRLMYSALTGESADEGITVYRVRKVCRPSRTEVPPGRPWVRSLGIFQDGVDRTAGRY